MQLYNSGDYQRSLDVDDTLRNVTCQIVKASIMAATNTLFVLTNEIVIVKKKMLGVAFVSERLRYD